ncbi:hypothetical protein PFISCL1PPCAC_20715, partial [Pristionchus fissidentatus]
IAKTVFDTVPTDILLQYLAVDMHLLSLDKEDGVSEIGGNGEVEVWNRLHSTDILNEDVAINPHHVTIAFLRQLDEPLPSRHFDLEFTVLVVEF